MEDPVIYDGVLGEQEEISLVLDMYRLKNSKSPRQKIRNTKMGSRRKIKGGEKEPKSLVYEWQLSL